MQVLMKLKKENVWKIFIIVLFAIINIMYLLLSLSEVYAYDEAYTVGMIQRDFKDILSITAQDVHSPFYYFVLKLFHMTLGMNGIVSAKIFSWIFMVGYMVFGVYVCKKHYSNRIVFYWLFLSAFLPCMIIQSTNGRMYTFALFWMSVSTYLAYSIIKAENIKKWILFTITTCITIYIHTFTMLEMVCVYGMLLVWSIYKRKKEMIRHILFSGVCVSVLYLPWLVILYHQFQRWTGKEAGWSNTIGKLSISSFRYYINEWFSSIEHPNDIVVLLGVLIFSISLFYTIKYILRQKDMMPILSLVIIGIILVIAILISLLIVPCFLGRYVFPLFGGIVLLMAVGISQIKHKWIQYCCLVVILFSGLFHYVDELKLENEKGLEVYKEIIELEYKESDVIMTDMYFQMFMSIYYPEKEYMIWGYKPLCIPFNNCQAFTDWEQLEGVDTVWYLSFKNFKAYDVSEKYECTQKIEFTYSYYDVVLEKYERFKN